MVEIKWRVHNPSGKRRIIVTKDLPGRRWLQALAKTDCRIEVCTSTDILNSEDIKAVIGPRCDGVIGQLTEAWKADILECLKSAGAKGYSNYAVGYNNVDIASATGLGLPVGNTPGVLTETTAELGVALTFAAARRIAEGDRFMRKGLFKGWLPNLFLGTLLRGKTIGVIGVGRIGASYAKTLVEGCRMNLIYYDLYKNQPLENYVAAYGEFLRSQGEQPVTCKRVETVEQVLREADIVSLYPVLDETTRHMIHAERLAMMKEDAILINASRGPLIDEAALVAHCQRHPDFRVGLDVFEDEPRMKPGLKDLDNIVIVPHLGSATRWTRQSMATLAAFNMVAMLLGYPVWSGSDTTIFLGDNPPKAAPSIVNADELNIPVFSENLSESSKKNGVEV